MSALGTLSTLRLRPYPAFAKPSPAARTGTFQPQAKNLRRNITGQTAYTHDWAHYPVRLNGRDCPFYSGPAPFNGYPWTPNQQPVVDDDGLIFWHAHRYALLWAVSPGPHVIAVTVRHQAGAGPKPELVINPNPSIGVPGTVVPASGPDNTASSLIASVNPTISGTLFIELVSTNVAENSKTTWGTIVTT